MRRLLLITLFLSLAGCGGPELQLWHTTDLAAEFTRADSDEVRTFADYLALEERLFAEMMDEVYGRTGTGPEQTLNRFSSGSAADPTLRDPNWNRSFERVPPRPRGGVLLLHGMSDSPYSLRALGELLDQRGFRVLGLRLPGHGTLPAGLTTVQWEDMAAATALAMSHLEQALPGKPLHIIGYSTGSALALNYALDREQSGEGAMPASLVLVSPAIGVSPAAALASFKRQLAVLPGLERMAWLNIDQEFDPYKYNSFATNAADQVHLLTRSVARRLAARAGRAESAPLPPILVLKSTVDATVSTNAVVDKLLEPLADGRHELVLYDINRSAVASPLLIDDPAPLTERLLADPQPFALTLVGSESPEASTVVAARRPAGATAFTGRRQLATPWPRGVVSLSHVALPFPADDPLYGAEPPADPGQLYLGHLPLQGERGLLTISPDFLFRLRHNPFYAHLEARVLDWIDVATGSP